MWRAKTGAVKVDGGMVDPLRLVVPLVLFSGAVSVACRNPLGMTGLSLACGVVTEAVVVVVMLGEVVECVETPGEAEDPPGFLGCWGLRRRGRYL